MSNRETIMDRAFLIEGKIYLRPLEIEDVNDRYLQWVIDPEVVLGGIESHFPEAVFKDKLFVNGKYVDHFMMSLSREEFLQRHPQPIIVRNLLRDAQKDYFIQGG